MSAKDSSLDGAASAHDDRLVRVGALRSLLAHPSLGALGGVVIVWATFALLAGDRGFVSLAGTATYLQVAAELGILAVAVALLMIGGEFDLSVGSMIGFTGIAMSILCVELGVSLPLAMLIALLLALALGFGNGYIVVKTGLPSFIVTLGTLFMIRGLTIGTTRLVTGRTQVGGLREVPGYETARMIFAGRIEFGGAGFSASILWWIAVVALGAYLLARTHYGNWILGTGGSAQAARQVGVPVRRVKIGLFMLTAASAWLVAMLQAVNYGGADVLRGEQREFFAIIAVVIGGTLLTGGYGSIIGAALGALIFGMVRQGIVFTGVDADWFQVFLGLMLLIAVLVNSYVRRRAAESRR